MVRVVLLLTLFCAASASAQVYQYVPIATDSTVWQIRTVHISSGPPHIQLNCLQSNRFLYTDGSDTVFNGSVYKKVYMRIRTRQTSVPFDTSSTCPLPAVQNYVADNPDIFYTGLLDSNRQVYSFNSQRQIMLFDFNLKVGEGTNTEMGTVIGIDTILVGNTYRKRYFTSLYGYIPDTIVEGIGSLRRGPYFSESPANPQKLDCYMQKGKQIYSAPGSGCTYIFPYGTPLNTETVHKEVKTTVIYPNPVNDVLNISCAGDEERIMLSDVSGRIIYNEAVNTKQVVISTGDIPSGLYMLMIKCKEQTRYYKVVKE